MALRALFFVLSRLPLAVLQALGLATAGLLWFFNTSRRGTAVRNIERCFPEMVPEEQWRLARRSIGHEMMTLFETALVWRGPLKRIRKLVKEFRGIELYDAAIAQGKGVILLTLHQGSFEAGAIPMSEHYKLAGLYKPQKGALNALSMEGRSRFGAQLIPAVGGTAGKRALELMAQGYGIYFMPDQDPPEGRGLFAPFMGIQAHTPTFVSKLAQRCDSPIVILWVERLPMARGFIAHFKAGNPAIHDPDLQVSLTALNADLEACVRECPEQYWWGYKRFRRRPKGEEPFYD